MGYKLSIPNIALTHPERLTSFFNEVITPFLERSGALLVQEIQLRTPVGATGELRQSFAVDLSGVDASSAVRGSAFQINHEAVVVSDNSYWQPVEFGSAPHWTSVRHLWLWAQQHSMSPYVLQLKIAREGGPAQHMVELGRAASVDAIRLDWQRTIGALAYLLRKP